MRVSLAVAGLLCTLGNLFASSSITPDHSSSWALNFGWINWRGNTANGVEVTASYCSGYLYSANVGWISLGSKPVQGVSYRNIAGDYGVNIDLDGNLRGYAYGANIGWILFDPQGSPRVDLATGKLAGNAYAANAGWISLSDQTTFVQTSPAPDAVDLDKDGIADIWEIRYAGSLEVFTSSSDTDHDGTSDLHEFFAGTDPLNAEDYLRILDISPGALARSIVVTWTSNPKRQYTLESRDDLSPASLWKVSAAVPAKANSSATSATFEISGNTQLFRIRVSQLVP